MATVNKAPVLTIRDKVALEVALLRQVLNDHAGLWRPVDKRMPLAKKFYAMLSTAYLNVGSRADRATARAKRMEVLSFLLGRQISSTAEMSLGEVSAMATWMEDPETKRIREDAILILRLLQRKEYRDYVDVRREVPPIPDSDQVPDML
jgi:hypothetical protein